MSDEELRARRRKKLKTFVLELVTATMFMTAFFGVQKIWDVYKTRRDAPDLAVRIVELTELLNLSVKRISEIEGEVKERQALVAKLERDATTAKQLSAVSREQVEAVAQALRVELQLQEKHHWWSANWLHAAYTLLGVILAELFHYFYPRVLRWWN
jgi:hypothetical protein